MLRDWLVCGVNDERIQRRLLSKVDLTFERGIKLAQAAESADKDTRHLKARDAGTSSPGIHYQASKPQAPRKKNLKKQHSTPQTPKQQRYVCWRCGRDNLAPNCHHMDVICKSCQKKGDFANMCRSKPGATLIYSAKNGHQWTANGILFIFKKLKSCKSAPSIQKQLSKLTALYRTSYGHTHLLKFKVHFEGTETPEEVGTGHMTN